MDVVDHTTEEWRPVVGYESEYLVSSLGNVKRIARGARRRKDKTLAQAPTYNGYQRVCLNGKKKRVHLLVLAAFVGPCPKGLQANHKDTDKSNNALTNLEYMTGLENIRHAYASGLGPVGEKHGMSKLSAADIQLIRQDYRRSKKGRGKSNRTELAARFGVHFSTIARIVSKRCWRHLV